MKSLWRLFLISFTLFVLLVVTAKMLLGPQGIFWSVVILLSAWIGMYLFGGWRLKTLFELQALEGQDPWQAVKAAEQLAAIARIPSPKVYIVNIDTPTSFSFGLNAQSGEIALSQGLLQKFNDQELRAVLAYEIFKIKSNDTIPLGFISALAGGIFLRSGFLSQKARQSQVKTWQKKISSIKEFIGLAWISLLIKCLLPQNRAFDLDKGASQLLDNPEHLARAIEKLHSYCESQPFRTPLSFGHLFIVNPFGQSPWFAWFFPQPSLPKRIKKLVGFYPI